MSKKGNQDHLGIDPEPGVATAGPTHDEMPASQDLSSLKQVREILVGPLSSELEHTVRELDQRLDRTINEISNTTDKRVGVVEDKLNSEHRRLTAEMGTHHDQYQRRFEDLEREMKSGIEELRGGVERLTGDLTKASDELRSELGKVREQVDHLVETVANRLDDECRSLRGELVDRASLSAALSEVALRLAGTSESMHEMDPDRPDIDIDSLLDG